LLFGFKSQLTSQPKKDLRKQGILWRNVASFKTVRVLSLNSLNSQALCWGVSLHFPVLFSEKCKKGGGWYKQKNDVFFALKA